MSTFSEYKFVVVGSGFFGGVVAHLVAKELGHPVLLLERRTHIGGNSYSEIDGETGIEYHRYGSHLFHTSNAKVWQFVNRFSAFSNYRHRVLSHYDGRMYTMPINLMTINNFFGKSFTPMEAESFVESEKSAESNIDPKNLEEKAISLIGRRLYEAFVRGYTMKQWETDPTQLPADIITRLPVRFSYNDFYFADSFEGLPLDGYGKIFERMLGIPGIRTELNCDYFQVRDSLRPDALVVFTGPVDRFFDYQFGRLGWRTLDFELERFPVTDYQGTAVVNYPTADYPYTRIHEFKHLHPERPLMRDKTLIMREFSRFAQSADEPYYPITTAENKQRHDSYKELAMLQQNVIFGGRLGTYRYLDMHQAIAAALKCFSVQVAPRLTNGHWTPSTEDAKETLE